MAKGSSKMTYNMPGNYNPEEAKKKAIGNPNKNVHSKKNGSNYGGYKAAQVTKKEDKKQAQTPKWIRTTITIMALVMIVFLTLQFTTFKGNTTFEYINSIYIGIVLTFMFLTRKETYARDDTTFSKIVAVIMIAGAILYYYTGITGLLTILGILH